MLGKKDKEKLEETKRLETVTSDTFSEVSVPTSVETPKVEPIVNKEVIEENKPVVETTNEEVVEKPIVEPIKEEILEPVIENKALSENLTIQKRKIINNEPTITPEVEEVPEQPVIPDIIKLPNEDDGYKAASVNYDEITKSIDKDLNEMENKIVKPVLNESIEPPISLPKVERAEETEKPADVKKTEVVNEVFSSVYPPKKEPVMFDDTVEIELPRLK
jgi:hypothetical protein